MNQRQVVSILFSDWRMIKVRKLILIFSILSSLFFVSCTFGESTEFVNNGCEFVKKNNDIYYREFNRNSFEEEALGAQYSQQTGVYNKIVCIDSEGKKQEICKDDGEGPLFLAQKRIYMNKREGYEYTVYSIDYNGENKKTHGNGKIQAIDTSRNILIFTAYDDTRGYLIHIYYYNKNQIRTITGNEYIDYLEHPGVMLLNLTEIYDLSVRELALGMCYVDNYDITEIKLIRSEVNSGGIQIDSAYFLDNYFYVSYGTYDGSAVMYQGGAVMRFKNDGSSFEILTGKNNVAPLKYPAFNVFFDGGYPCIKFGVEANGPNRSGILKLSPVREFHIVDSLNTTPIPQLFDNELIMCDDGKDIILLNTGEIESFGEDDSIRFVNLIDDKLFFFVNKNLVVDAAEIYGWRTLYKCIQTSVFVKTLSSNSIELLYSF